MNRRKFITGIAASGAALAAEEFFLPFAEAVDVPSFNFAHITDLHLDVRGENSWQYREKSVPLFIDTLRQIVRLPKLKFVVFGGDQIHYGPRDKESLAVFQEWTTRHLNMPIYMLLGNTEVSPITGVSRLSKEDYVKAWSGRGLRPGHTSWAFDPVSGVRVIGFDVTVDGKPYGEAGPQALKWLEKELAAHRSKKLIILFTHQLLMPTTPKDMTPEWSFWMVRNHEQVRALINRFPNVRLAVSGHHHVSRVVSERRTTYVADPAIVTYPCAFRFFTVDRQGIYLKNIGLGDKEAVARARELLVTDAYAKLYDSASPQKAADYSAGLTREDRETRLKL